MYDDLERVRKALSAEQLFATSSLFENYAQTPYNPDVLVLAKGDLSIYSEMRRDAQIKSLLWLKKYAICGSGWNIEAGKGGDKDSQAEAIKFIEANLAQLNIPDFGTALEQILSSIEYGFSITEPVFKNRGGKTYLSKLKTRAPHTFLLETNDYGDLDTIRQYTGGADVEIKYKDIPRFLHMTYQGEFDNPYGTSDLQSVYLPWFSKNAIIKFWNMYLEMWGNPHIVITTPAQLHSTDRDKLITLIKTLQTKTGFVLPEGVKLEAIFPGTGNVDGFEKAINQYNMMIARAMLVPDLMGMGGSETKGGSYALGKEHMSTFLFLINKLKGDVERLINRHVIYPLAYWNFGYDFSTSPVFKFKQPNDAQKLEYLNLWSEAVQGNVWIPTNSEIDHFKDEISFPTDEASPIERPDKRGINDS